MRLLQRGMWWNALTSAGYGSGPRDRDDHHDRRDGHHVEQVSLPCGHAHVFDSLHGQNGVSSKLGAALAGPEPAPGFGFGV